MKRPPDKPVPLTLWMLDLDREVPVSHLTLLEHWLSDDERARYLRFRFDRDRRRFLLCRALMREVLANRLGLAPGAVRFTTNTWGKPMLVNTPGAPSFNLSHTRGMAVLAVCDEAVVGVDVENPQRQVEPEKIAHRYFSALECQQLQGLEGEALREGFFAFWTLKEAYIKAVGKGLAIPLDSFSFHLGGSGVAISFSDTLEDDPEGWQFRRLSLPGDHPAALAVQGAGPLKLEYRQGVPGRGYEQVDLAVPL